MFITEGTRDPHLWKQGGGHRTAQRENPSAGDRVAQHCVKVAQSWVVGHLGRGGHGPGDFLELRQTLDQRPFC